MLHDHLSAQGLPFWGCSCRLVTGPNVRAIEEHHAQSKVRSFTLKKGLSVAEHRLVAEELGRDLPRAEPGRGSSVFRYVQMLPSVLVENCRHGSPQNARRAFSLPFELHRSVLSYRPCIMGKRCSQHDHRKKLGGPIHA